MCTFMAAVVLVVVLLSSDWTASGLIPGPCSLRVKGFVSNAEPQIVPTAVGEYVVTGSSSYCHQSKNVCE